MTPEDRTKARREIVRVLRNLSTYHTDEDAADLILYALDCLGAERGQNHWIMHCPHCRGKFRGPPVGEAESQSPKREKLVSEPNSSLKCPDDGTCHHGCAEHYNGACWRVFNAEPLSVAGWGEKWPPRIKAAMMKLLSEARAEGGER